MPITPDSPVADGARNRGERRRTRLREFQAQLVERMQAARSGTDAHVNWLGIEVGATRWLVSLQQAGEIVPVGALTPVPLTQDWFMGLANIRGNLVAVVDLARFLGGAATLIDKESRIVAFGPALAFNGGLLVSRVLGLRNLSRMQSAGADGELVDEEGQAWRELDLAQLLRDPRYLQVGI